MTDKDTLQVTWRYTQDYIDRHYINTGESLDADQVTTLVVEPRHRPLALKMRRSESARQVRGAIPILRYRVHAATFSDPESTRPLARRGYVERKVAEFRHQPTGDDLWEAIRAMLEFDIEGMEAHLKERYAEQRDQWKAERELLQTLKDKRRNIDLLITEVASIDFDRFDFKSLLLDTLTEYRDSLDQ